MTASTDDFFRSRLDHMIDLRHPLAVLANRMPWQEIEASLAHRFARQAKAGKKIEDLDNMDFFGATASLSGGGVSNAGRPRLPLRLMASLLVPQARLQRERRRRLPALGRDAHLAVLLRPGLL